MDQPGFFKISDRQKVAPMRVFKMFRQEPCGFAPVFPRHAANLLL
jgi:hypothetical protein